MMGGSRFELPDSVLEVLPTDAFEQLDVARKITSMALSTRVSALESEASLLRAQLTDRDNVVNELNKQIEGLNGSLVEAVNNLSIAHADKERLLKENGVLCNTVKKLNRDVTKLEGFKKALMNSLQEDEDTPGGAPKTAVTLQASLSSQSLDYDAMSPPSRTASVQSHFSETSLNAEERDTDASKPPRISQNLLLASQTSTPHLTPPASPSILSASVSPTRKSIPASPRRHAVSFATTRGMHDDRVGLSSVSSSPYGSMSSYDSGSPAGRTRVDGKEFFRQVRSRLSYEQFASFLANVKELNSHKQTKEETLRKAQEIFGPDNKDLYTIFESLITRNTH